MKNEKKTEYTGWMRAETTPVMVSIATLQRMMYAMSNSTIALLMEEDPEIVAQITESTNNEMQTLENIFVGIYNSIDVESDTDFTEIIEDAIESIQMTKDLTEEWIENNTKK